MDNDELQAQSSHNPSPTPKHQIQSEDSTRIDARQELRRIPAHLFSSGGGRERVARDLHVKTALGQGTIITATVPVERHA